MGGPHLPKEAESSFLLRFRFGGDRRTANGLGHLPDRPRDWRIFLGDRAGGVLHPPHYVKVVGNLPLRRPGQRSGNVLLGNLHLARVVPIDHDFYLGAALSRKLPDQAI